MESKALAMMQAAAGKAQAVVAALPAAEPPTGPSWCSYATQRKAYADAWLAVLRVPLPPDALRRVLLALPVRLLPLFPGRTSLLLADFLTSAVEAGGSLALLALESLFTLMQGQGLEYPKFYPTLYALLGAPETAAARYKARFFVLLDLFLSTPALPAYLAAAFAKRSARIALTASPGFAKLAIGLIHNLAVRHPRALVPLLHRAAPGTPTSSSSSSRPTSRAHAHAWPSPADPFDALTHDPSLCKAGDSSLWEVVALAGHAAASVAHAARALAESSDAARAEVDIADLAGEDAGTTTAGAGGVVGSAAGADGGNSGQGKRKEKGGPRGLSYAALATAELTRQVRAKIDPKSRKPGQDQTAIPKDRSWVPVEVHYEYRVQPGVIGIAGPQAVGATASVLAAATDLSC